MFLSWQRSDEAFFASGACHILAEIFMQLHKNEGYKIIHIKPLQHKQGDHMFATNGTWAFDFNGWSKEIDLIEVNQKACSNKFEGWNCELVEVKEDFDEYYKQTHHRLPWQYPQLPWERAYKYIENFPPHPPARPTI